MAKLPSTGEKRTIQKKKKMNISFSDWELDVELHVAQLLLQLSNTHSLPHHHHKEERYGGASNESGGSSSTSSITLEEEEEEADGYPKRRMKRFRLVDQIYKSTKPINTC
ncbi:hypothetical protein JCGZ_16901 [Jatropha curcas]|uniref:Uncharacterized protein n=1 Tax=Jatropha curcas TaxID=180498 RepID=A0A067LHD0_JATCU|nr:hypothetical protein JCGZ_16901 [Jatropha curcas]